MNICYCGFGRAYVTKVDASMTLKDANMAGQLRQLEERGLSQFRLVPQYGFKFGVARLLGPPQQGAPKSISRVKRALDHAEQL